MSDKLDVHTNLQPAISKLRTVVEGLGKSESMAAADEIAAKESVLAHFQPIFSPERIGTITEEDFKSFLLAENNKHWSGLHRQGGFITADMDLLRSALVLLVDESKPIQERLEKLVTKSGPMVPRLSRAVLTAILQVCYPDKYGVWNGTSEAGMKALEAWPKFEKGAGFGKRYLAVNQVLLTMAQAVDVDLWTLDALWWAFLKIPPETDGPSGGDETIQKYTQQFGLERYLHEFMRDNWGKIHQFKDWDLYTQDGEMLGYEYFTPIGRIDLLARHKTEQKWLVIELKRNQSSDDTVGQMLRYMGWLAENMAESGDEVQGLIVSHASDERLRYALRFTRNVEQMLYEVDFHLKKP